MKTNASAEDLTKSLWEIWFNGIKEATEKLTNSPPESGNAELLFPVWDKVIQEMFLLFPGQDTWEFLTQTEKIQSHRGKAFSFEHFQEEFVESKFSAKRVDH